MLFKLNVSMSWLSHAVTFDEEYREYRDTQYTIHPPNIGEGLVQGVTLLGRGIVGGVTSLYTLPREGFREEKAVGIVKGVAKAIVSLPMKPIGGVFDFLAKSCEGTLNNLGRGYRVQVRRKEPETRELSIQQLTNLHQTVIDYDESVNGHVILFDERTGKVRERFMVITTTIYLFKLTDLERENIRQAKILDIDYLEKIVKPIYPETNFTLVFRDGTVYNLISPNRPILYVTTLPYLFLA